MDPEEGSTMGRGGWPPPPPSTRPRTSASLPASTNHTQILIFKSHILSKAISKVFGNRCTSNNEVQKFIVSNIWHLTMHCPKIIKGYVLWIKVCVLYMCVCLTHTHTHTVYSESTLCVSHYHQLPHAINSVIYNLHYLRFLTNIVNKIKMEYFCFRWNSNSTIPCLIAACSKLLKI